MKKMVFCFVSIIMVLMGCLSGGTSYSNSPGMDMDAAIKEAATQMGENLSGGTEVAIVSVASSSAQLSEYVISRLEAALVSGKKLVVVDRANLDKIREEEGFQYSGEVDDNSAKSIGKKLGAGAIVTGAFTSIGDMYSLTLKAINIETATVAVSYPADIAKSARIDALLTSGGGAGSGTAGTKAAQASGNAAKAPVAPVEPPSPAKEYNIGEEGPAGGFVFYDKGYYADGWRYMEAGSKDIGSGLPWSASQKEVRGTNTSVGSGKRNSELIRSSGETVAAALAALNYNQGGYNDWFLPSLDELNFMYQNLKQKGGFSGKWYWSSSEYSGNVWNCAWRQNFSNGEQHYGNMYGKDQVHSVRAIRQF